VVAAFLLKACPRRQAVADAGSYSAKPSSLDAPMPNAQLPHAVELFSEINARAACGSDVFKKQTKAW
jgi:hypothetical protein